MFRALALAAVAVTASCASALTGINDTALRLEFANGVCSGTAVGTRLLLTADHCFDGGNRLLKINGQEAHALKIERDGKDHVLVRVTTKFHRYAKVGPTPQVADRVRWVGMPAGEDRVYREAYVTRVTDEVWLDGQAFHGDSGSGLFDAKGRLVAVLSGGKSWQSRSGMEFRMTIAYPLEFTPEQWRAVQ